MHEKEYEEIREENIKRYGTEVNKYGKVLLSNLYSDRTHFIFELIQNAEDAAQRDSRIGEKGKKYYVKFSLYGNRLEIVNNGIPFNINDVKGISRVVGGTKEEDLMQIGKFGIGFKSVYAYTNSPEVHSGEWHFKILNYVHPYPVELRSVSNTLFVLPFNKQSVPKETAAREISEALNNLQLRTLLFLRNIYEIGYVNKINNTTTRYIKNSKVVDRNEELGVELLFVVLSKESSESHTRVEEYWYVLRKQITLKVPETEEQKNIHVEIAFKYSKELDEIDEDKEPYLVAYFPTKQYTGLSFLIQAPFNTTPSREAIKDYDKWNKNLIFEIAELLDVGLELLKKHKLLTVNFLNTLVYDIEKVSEDRSLNIFSPIYEIIKTNLKSGAYLITNNGDYAAGDEVLIGRGKDLIDLLSEEQTKELFRRSKWLTPEITPDKTPKLYKFLKEAIEIPIVDPDKFGSKITKEFLENQPFEWIDKFYVFLKKRYTLWKKKTYPSEKEGILRRKPIIRLIDGTHVVPFNDYGEPVVFLPLKNVKHNSQGWKILVKHYKLAEVENLSSEALDFLNMLGLKEIDIIDVVIDIIFRRFRPWKEDWDEEINEDEELKEMPLDTSFKYLTFILRAWDKIHNNKIKTPREDDFYRDIKRCQFIYARNMNDSRHYYCSPDDKLYVSSVFNEEYGEEIEVFYAGNDDIWVVDDAYMEAIKNEENPIHVTLKNIYGENCDSNCLKKKFVEFLVDIGCRDRIVVDTRYREDFKGYVLIDDSYGNHERGLDGFCPDAEIEELKFALDNITPEKARVIWNVLKRDGNWKKIRGFVEWSSRKGFINSKVTEKMSEIGRLLINTVWIPDKEGNFRKPSEITLYEVNPIIETDDELSKVIASKLGFKKEIYENIEDIMANLNIQIKEEQKEEAKKAMAKFIELIQMGKISVINELLEKMSVTFDTSETSNIQSKEEIYEHWMDSLSKTGHIIEKDETPQSGHKSDKKGGSTILSEGEAINETTTKLVQKSDEINAKQYLFEQYGGHCQICGTLLNVGKEMPYFVVHKIAKFEGKNKWAYSKFNILSVCPNCHALIDHGGADLTNIFEMAKKVKNGEYTAEQIPNRPGEGQYSMGYEIDVIVAGESVKLFITENHMSEIVQFIEKNYVKE